MNNEDYVRPAAYTSGAAARDALSSLPVRPNGNGTSTDYRFQKPIAFNGLLTNRLLTGLSGAEFARLLPYLEPVSLVSGQDVFRFGEPVDYIYFPETAVLSHVYFLEDGSTTGAAIIGPEGIVGLAAVLDGKTASYWTQVTIGGSAVRVKPHVIKQEFARGQTMQRLMLGYTRLRLTQLSQRAVCNSRHTLHQRLCTWLLMVHDRVGDDQLSLTHERIAQHLGARRAGITTAFNALREECLLKYRRGYVQIIDRERLELEACECYKAIQDLSK